MRIPSSTFHTIAISVALMLSSGAASAQTLVGQCGQRVHGKAYLAADLDCSGDAVAAPTLSMDNAATLDLRGFTVTSRPGSATTIICKHDCSFTGPGAIVGADGDVIEATQNSWSGSRIKVNGLTLTGGSVGLAAARVDVTGSTITGCGETGIWSGLAYVDNSTVSNNGFNPRIGEATGVFGQIKSIITNSTVTGNAHAGVSSWQIRLSGSSVSGNAAASDCAGASPRYNCADLVSNVHKPRLLASSCGHSVDFSSYPIIGSWGVCAGD